MNVAQIENNLKLLVYSLDKETFIYNLLESYYLPKASISRLQKGNLNLSKVPGEVSWKKKLFFKEELNKDLHLTISALKNVFDEINDRFAENFRVGVHLVMVHRDIPEIGVGLSKTGNVPAKRAGGCGGLLVFSDGVGCVSFQ